MAIKKAWVGGIRLVAVVLCCQLCTGLLAGAVWAGGTAARADDESTAGAPASATGEEASKGDQGFAGDDSCKDCHAGYSLTGPHGATTDPRAPAAQHSCESCHGPAAAHVQFQEDESGEDPNVAALRIGPKSKISPPERDAICLACHDGGHEALWQGSTHQLRDVSCVDCHSPHSKFPNYLRAAGEAELCSSCHKDVKAQLQRSSHHPLREGKMQCSDCHNSHGTVTEKLISADSVNEKCYECHAELRGPYVWEHAPVQENCMTCHTPHGSMHEQLLVQKVPFLCQTCHSNAGHPGTLLAIPASSKNKSPYTMLPNTGFYRACQNCHVAVHGSNSPSGKSLIR